MSDGLWQYLTEIDYICDNDQYVSSNTTAALNATITANPVNVTTTTNESLTNPCMVQNTYFSLQYSMFTNCGIEVIGGILFFITAIFIVRDKRRCEHAVVGE